MTFKEGRYTNEVREVIMELLNLMVSMAKVNQVITTDPSQLGDYHLLGPSVESYREARFFPKSKSVRL